MRDGAITARKVTREAKRKRNRIILWTGLFLLSAVLGVGGGIFLVLLRDLPQVRSLEEYHPSTITWLYSDDDQVFSEFYRERRIVVPLSKIPKHLKEAILAVEDSRFYHHYGIDLVGILRALNKNLKAGRIVEGGSTITQQLTKVLFLTPERSLSRKLKEAVLALLIESRYTKDEILELYCNQIYMGSGAYGVEAAAQTYFGKSLSQINLAEAALLAGLPKAPTRFSPLNNPDRAKKRMRHVLERMEEEGYIIKAEARKAADSLLNLNPTIRKKGEAAYFVEYVRKYLEETYGSYALYRGGLKVYTTLDLKMQKSAYQVLRKGLKKLEKQGGPRIVMRGEEVEDYFRKYSRSFPRVGDVVVGRVIEVRSQFLRLKIGEGSGFMDRRDMDRAKTEDPISLFRKGDLVWARVLEIDREAGNDQYRVALDQEPQAEGALLAIDPGSGYIKAMVGGYDFAKSQFNRAIQAKRQPGSAFKPFIYLTAIANGFAPSDIILDLPVSYPTGALDEEWKPKNFTDKFYGPNTLRTALEKSRNVSAVRLLEKIGLKPVIEMAHRMGISSFLHPHLSLALGTSEVNLLELTSAYGVLANQGVRLEPTTIRTIVDDSGKILERWHPQATEVIRSDLAYIVTDMLKGVVERGTGRRARVLGRPVAAKTGTTNDAQDAWFVGYTPQLVAGVWVGYDNPKSLGANATGGGIATPIWIDFFQKALADEPFQDFLPPKKVVFRSIDAGTGLLATPECEEVITEVFIRGTEPTQYCSHNEEQPVASSKDES